jgi:hypothetical protein
MYDKVKDSGERQEFQTGSVRDKQEGKGRYDLIPPYPLKRLAVHYENGARKYKERNWEKGQNTARYYESAMRHLLDYMSGDRSEDHLSAVVWNIFGLIFTEEMVRLGKLPPELDDLPKPGTYNQV